MPTQYVRDLGAGPVNIVQDFTPAGSTTRSVSGLFDNYQVPTTSVPEPGTLALLGLGLAGLGLARRKQTA